jgi:succinate dehydrogenase flavin-adding protein (antitoxin of CptAB toxin-antitoxin module)
MCEDFRRCKEAYRHWSQSESENSSPRSEEYRELLENLDSEISQYIMENPMKVDKRKKPFNLQS